jgi:hypothetical protein
LLHQDPPHLSAAMHSVVLLLSARTLGVR